MRGLSVAEEEVEKNSGGEFETTIFPEFYTQLTVSGKPYMEALPLVSTKPGQA